MVSKIRSRTNQTVDEVYLWNGFLLETLHFKTDRSDHDVGFPTSDFAVEFARNGILTAVRTIPRKHRTR